MSSTTNRKPCECSCAECLSYNKHIGCICQIKTDEWFKKELSLSYQDGYTKGREEERERLIEKVKKEVPIVDSRYGDAITWNIARVRCLQALEEKEV